MTSFIIPIYNAEAYLRRCVESVLAQTLKDIEVILVDDGSTDGSLKLAQSLSKQDERVVVLTQAHAGQSAARNKALLYAKGEYIAFVDADDSIVPEWLERHLKAISGVDYVQSGYTRVRPDGSVIYHQLSVLIHQFTSPCMRVYRKEVLQGKRFPEGMIYEDVIWSVDLWLSRAKCRLIYYTGYHYTLNPESTTSRPHPEAQERVLSELKKRFHDTGFLGKFTVGYTILRLKLHFWKS